MNSLSKNIRFYVLSFTLLLSLGVYVYYKITIPDGISQTVKFTESYGLLSLIYLYLTLFASPVTRLFPFFPFRGQYVKARRALGISVFYFAWLHTLIAFFGQLDGFNGLGFLDDKYLWAIGLSFVALIILTMMAATSFDKLVKKLSYPKWKLLHRLVYLAAMLTLIHTFMLGTHFSSLTSISSLILLFALALLLILEAVRFDRFLKLKFVNLPNMSFTTVIVAASVVGGLIYLLVPNSSGNGVSFDIHAAHIQLAKEAQQTANNSNSTFTGLGGSISPNNPLSSALAGDKTLRYTVSFLHEAIISANQDTNLTFQVYNASSGNKVDLFSFVYTKIAHLVIVDNELKYYAHIHPAEDDNGLIVTTQFPHDGRYHLYLDFQPLGAIEQQFAFSVDVGQNPQIAKSTQPVDTNLTKTFGNYQVSLKTPNPMLASDMSIGKESLTFTIKDNKGNPVTYLKPYLAAFGHLVMINESTYDYIHVHPSNVVAPAPNASGGPIVDFLPLGLYSPIKPGIYRVFAQFNPNNQLFTADFTIQIK